MIWTLFVLIIGAISVIVMNRAFIMNRKKGERMNEKSKINRIKAVIEVCEKSKKNIAPTFYEMAEAIAYERIMAIVSEEEGAE